MANILINGFSAKIGGGKAIFEDYLSMLPQAGPDDTNDYFIITPNDTAYSSRADKRIHILRTPPFYQRLIFLPLFYAYLVHCIVRENRIDAVFNFGDVILPIHVPQVYFFDWPYLVYPESVVWDRIDLRGYVFRRVKYHVIKSTLKFATSVIVQTPTMATRLRKLYGITNVTVVRSPVTLSSMKKTQIKNFGLPKDRKLLLCLANYATHKNLEILVPLARLMRRNASKFTIITTLNPSESNTVRNLLEAAKSERLEEYIVNVGHVEPLHIPALFEQCHALLLPTLLETYGLPFVEAMYNKRTIITSNLDFARDVCGDVAYYCDPLDARSIYEAICEAFADESARQDKIELGFKKALELNDWPAAFQAYQNCLKEVCASRAKFCVNQSTLSGPSGTISGQAGRY